MFLVDTWLEKLRSRGTAISLGAGLVLSAIWELAKDAWAGWTRDRIAEQAEPFARLQPELLSAALDLHWLALPAVVLSVLLVTTWISAFIELRATSGRDLGTDGRSASLAPKSFLDWIPQAVRHPFGNSLLILSGILASVVAMTPALERSDRAGWLLGAGLLGYAAAAAVVSRWPPSPREFRQLRSMRRRVFQLLRERSRQASEEHRAELQPLTAAALARIREEINPPFRQLLRQTTELRAEIAVFDRASAAPDSDILNELRSLEQHYEAATVECIRIALNLEARLVALVQEPDEELPARLKDWVVDLSSLRVVVEAGLHGPASAPWRGPAPAAEPDAESRDREPVERPEDLLDLVKYALRHLNRPPALAKSELIVRLPRSIRQVRSQPGGAAAAGATPLALGQALRALVVDAIERMNVEHAEAIEYQILHRAYVQGLDNKTIMIRFDIPESTFYRHLAHAVEALADELWQQEQLLAARRPNPVALDYLG